MRRYDFDLVVIGAGSAGVRAARRAAELGAQVAIVEAREVGGTCVNRGCIPKKLLVMASEYGAYLGEARAYGWNAAPGRLDWPRLVRNKDREIERLNGAYEGLLDRAGVLLRRGPARLIDPHTVAIDSERLSGRFILIATGGAPRVPDVPGKEQAVTSDQVFSLERFPPRVIVVGGGYVAVELAGIFKGLGAATTLIHRGARLLSGFDERLCRFLAEQMVLRGVDLRFDTELTAISRSNSALIARYAKATEQHTDLIVLATGRAPNTRGLGLEDIGVRLSPSAAVLVDADYRSSVPSVYAAGDVIERVRLTPVAVAEGTLVAEHLFGGRPRAIDYENIPSAVFSQPCLASVGPNEAQARARFGRVAVYEGRFTPLRNRLLDAREEALVRLIVDVASDRVVGAQMVGADAAEVIQGVAIAVRSGATKADFDATLGIHPTLAEELVTLRAALP
ncbi:MAG: glutathione-disulfide reductase [Gammaproteobacteria bacterium]